MSEIPEDSGPKTTFVQVCHMKAHFDNGDNDVFCRLCFMKELFSNMMVTVREKETQSVILA